MRKNGKAHLTRSRINSCDLRAWKAVRGPAPAQEEDEERPGRGDEHSLADAGWGNSFTQPIAARIEMLSTGVQLPVAVKVFGSKLGEINASSRRSPRFSARFAKRRTSSPTRSPARVCRDPHRPRQANALASMSATCRTLSRRRWAASP